MPSPIKLKRDAIAEALLEIRFSHDSLSEAILGRLLNAPIWSSFKQVRLPLGEIPHQIRENDQLLKYQPTFELGDDTNKNYKVRIGSNVLSFHVVGHYPGWAIFRDELNKMIDVLIDDQNLINIERISLRYLNALNKQEHFIANIHTLNISLLVANKSPGEDIFLAYNRASQNLTAVIRIATKSFVSGNFPLESNSFIDVEVISETFHKPQSRNLVKDWLENAHNFEKECFFELLPEKVIEKLKEL
jgi:uncharacterized protein (TIGR04255 family)